MRRRMMWVGLMAAALALAACPRAYRGGPGTDRPGMDEDAMSVRLDRTDVDYLAEETEKELFSSRFWKAQVQQRADQPVFAIWPMANQTSQHIGDQLDTLLSKFQTELVRSGEVRVVAREQQADLAREIEWQQDEMFDPRESARIGRQLGADYLITGKMMSADERLRKERRVQYSLFVQVIEVETGLIVFQNEAIRSKLRKR
ncbi:MAG: CsgG/HfaB family protein [Myxococcota bacterium]